MFIQMHWIQSAIFVKRQLHEQNIDNSLIQIREQMYNHFFAKHHEFGYIPNEMSRQDLLRRHFTIMDFSEDEIKGIIDSSLKKNDLKEKYEFAITNIFNQPITVSQNFQNDYFNTAIKELITPVNGNQVETLHLYIEDKNYIIKKMGGLIAASIFFTCIIISAFALTIRTMFKQKNLSEIKSDFINNMTHELKTPLATISLAIDALVNEKVIHDVEKIRYYSGMIKDENKRMNKQVEKILQAARIERQEIKLNLVELNAHDVITKVTDNLQLQIQEKNGTISLNLNADKSLIEADEVHFSNIIFNLLDNAIKYSKGNLHIDVETSIAHNDMLAIKIMDNGIGMSKETQQRVFEKFYRAHTGNIHNVKGFGLGLSYVKAITEAHGGKVKVESALGKGSTFTLFLPFHPEG